MEKMTNVIASTINPLRKQIMDCAGEKGNAEQEKRPLHHGSFPTVSGAMSGLNLSGKRGFGWRARKSGSMISQNS